jgi:hypothetical protein
LMTSSDFRKACTYISCVNGALTTRNVPSKYQVLTTLRTVHSMGRMSAFLVENTLRRLDFLYNMGRMNAREHIFMVQVISLYLANVVTRTYSRHRCTVLTWELDSDCITVITETSPTRPHLPVIFPGETGDGQAVGGAGLVSAVQLVVIRVTACVTRAARYRHGVSSRAPPHPILGGTSALVDISCQSGRFVASILYNITACILS